ncbi:MAG TPA: response regulator [Elusimicrobiales bacterium]|nr:response regulator [Elusimicrobiales bacterium]
MPKVLAVEDNPAILDFYVEFFTDQGFEVQTSEDAFSAITKQQQFKADIIILDLNIPAGGGMLVFDTLRNRLHDAVPIIFSTGKPEMLPNLTNIHNVAVVSKPTDPEKLLAEVKKLLPKIFSPVMNPVPPPPPGQARAAGFKILVVDDDTMILDLYKEILVKAGFEIQTAEDAMGAVTKFQEFKPALVILDVDMPAGGGKKVFERLRVQLASPAPIIFSTGSPESVASLEKNLNVIVLRKPLTPAILLGAVKTLLKIA